MVETVEHKLTPDEEDVVFDMLVARCIESGVPFEGFDDDSCDDGDGWDGQDNRCNCGARRVYWELAHHENTVTGTFDYYIYPCAD